MKRLIVIRGGGEIATGIAIYLYRAGFRIMVLEQEAPTSIRREMSFADAVYDGEKTVERVNCRRVESVKEAKECLKRNEVVIYVDPAASCVRELEPEILVDAILAEENLGTERSMAGHTIGLGPGFCAGRDVDAVIETMRGYNLGRIVYEGFTRKNPDAPSHVGNSNTLEHIVHAPAGGSVELLRQISFAVKEGEVFARIHQEDGNVVEVASPINGILRGSIRNDSAVEKGQKIADINPNLSHSQCFRLSDKVRCIAGSVLETVMIWRSAEKKRFFR
ncbi:MAG: EF2563 family selenium-dependent molybdenum hydroxylase system protein [Selenomonadaceae bacterium]|nr:EF2563 family selenium-dependent molybdenum hydroxylase system protein [Selenomonadaceae bacterium]